MAFNIPHKEQTSSKWLTATLVSVYIIIAVLALLYGVDSTSKQNAAPDNNKVKPNYSITG
jgi:hypothetical protein